MEFFVRRLTPPALKEKALQFLIETPHATWEQLINHVSTEDLSFAGSSDFTGRVSSIKIDRWYKRPAPRISKSNEKLAQPTTQMSVETNTRNKKLLFLS